MKFEVGWNPYLAIQSYKNVRAVQDPLIIPGGSVYTLTLENDFQPGKLQLLPGPQKGGPAKLRLIRESAGGLVTTADLDLAGNTWQAFPLAPEPGGTLSLVNLEPAQPAALAGRSSAASRTPDLGGPGRGWSRSPWMTRRSTSSGRPFSPRRGPSRGRPIVSRRSRTRAPRCSGGSVPGRELTGQGYAPGSGLPKRLSPRS